MQDFEAKCFRFIFSQSKTWTTNHRQSQTKIMYMEPFLSSGKSLTPPSTCTAWWHWQCSDWDDCTAAVFSVASVALFLFVFLITFSTCISNHKANQWLKSIHTLRGCNKCWISVLLKKEKPRLLCTFSNATHLIYLLPIESNLLPQTLDYDSVLCNFESIIKH